MKKYLQNGWTAFTEPNEDRPGVGVFLEHTSGDVCSLACADNMGETSDGRPVPRNVVDMVWDWIDEADIDY